MCGLNSGLGTGVSGWDLDEHVSIGTLPLHNDSSP